MIQKDNKMNRELPEEIKQILEEVKKLFVEIYGDSLKEVILYGSYARGDYTEGSDIDLIILLDNVNETILSEREYYSKLIWEIDLRYDVVISVLPMSEETYRTRQWPVILNAKREGVCI